MKTDTEEINLSGMLGLFNVTNRHPLTYCLMNGSRSQSAFVFASLLTVCIICRGKRDGGDAFGVARRMMVKESHKEVKTMTSAPALETQEMKLSRALELIGGSIDPEIAESYTSLEERILAQALENVELAERRLREIQKLVGDLGEILV